MFLRELERRIRRLDLFQRGNANPADGVARMTRLTPSSYLRQHCPVEMGAALADKIRAR